jgi:hypothetical protein
MKFAVLAGCCLVALFSTVTEAAEDGKEPSSVNQLCVVDKSTGFKWDKGRWDTVEFSARKYIITKVDFRKYSGGEKFNFDTVYLNCTIPYITSHDNDGAARLSDELYFYHVCLSVKDVGDSTGSAYYCRETHVKFEGRWKTLFSCKHSDTDTLLFVQNEYFSHSLTSVPINHDISTSTFVEIGKCSGI